MFTLHAGDSSDSGPCPCCGDMSRLVTGVVNRKGATYAAYQVHWTLGQIPRHGAEFYLFLGDWSDSALPADRFGIALHYFVDGPRNGFSVVDANETPIANVSFIGSALRRDEVVGTSLAKAAFDLVDLLWLHDPRIAEITAAAAAAAGPPH